MGFYAKVWWLDAAGGIILSLYVIINWSFTSVEHIRNLTGCAATADERNILLYLTMRFAKTIKQIQGINAYHAGDKLIVEVDIVLDGNMALRDSHDLGESLQYVLESVPYVDRAFVSLIAIHLLCFGVCWRPFGSSRFVHFFHVVYSNSFQNRYMQIIPLITSQHTCRSSKIKS